MAEQVEQTDFPDWPDSELQACKAYPVTGEAGSYGSALPVATWADTEGLARYDIVRAVFLQSNGDVTKAFYAEMNARGIPGQLAVALFRAQKRSEAAKSYKGKRFKNAAYDVKDWSLTEVCRVLKSANGKYRWGWQYDSRSVNYEHVLYVDLPTGQASFHSHSRHAGPDFEGQWTKGEGAREAILRFCATVGE